MNVSAGEEAERVGVADRDRVDVFEVVVGITMRESDSDRIGGVDTADDVRG